MTKAARILTITALCAIVAFAANTKEDKPGPQPVFVKLALDKNEPPIPVKFVFKLKFEYCLAPGLNSENPPTPPDPRKHKCSDKQDKVGVNGAAIVAAFKDSTEYSLKAVDKHHILVFCKAKYCTHDSRMRKAIEDLARPSPRYFDDVDVDAAIAGQLPGLVPTYSHGKASGRLIGRHTLRIEAENKILDPQTLKDDLASATAANIKDKKPPAAAANVQRIPLGDFCIATTLDGADPVRPGDKGVCPDKTRKAPAGNAAAIAAAVADDKTKVTAESPNSLVLACGAAACDNDLVGLLTATADQMALPKPAYIQDIPVLPGTEREAAKKIANWSNNAITADVLQAESIRLKSDTKVLPADLQVFQERLREAGFGRPEPPPAQRMFYADAGAVVNSLAGAPPAASPLAPGTTPPDTSGSSPGAGAASPGAASTTATTPSATATAPTSAPAASSPSSLAAGMTPVGDTVVFTSNPHVTDGQRTKLLTLLDIPRPEVLLNLWSLQSSSPKGKELADESQQIRSAVSVHNGALQNAIEFGWAYLSRQMKNPEYFDKDFADYLTRRFVSEPTVCMEKPQDPGCIPAEKRDLWGLCKARAYCLGYTQAFKPLKPTLTNILLGLMAAKDHFRAVFTTIGCMEGKYEVYGATCFPERGAIAAEVPAAPAPQGGLPSEPQACLRAALRQARANGGQLSCESMDLAVMQAREQCRLPAALPLTCFTVQAAQSFVPYHGFSTFSPEQLADLTEKPIAEIRSQLPDNEASSSTTPLGLLRAATVNFLFNYKMAQEFPEEFSTYALSHSAQELNAEFNPLVVAFNQDVAAFSRGLMQRVQDKLHDSHWYTPWSGTHRSFVADGVITVRGISGVESLVDTDTQSAFSVPQYQTLQSVMNNLGNLAGSPAAPANNSTTSTTTVNGNTTTAVMGPTPMPPPPPASDNLLNLLPAGLKKASLPLALATAVAPTPATAQIGRQLTLDVTPHTLPGASSAELDIKLWAQEDSPPTLYKDGGTGPQNDPISRVARHNVFTRVRVESVKLFEVSSFSALVQRPRAKLPLLPIPFVEIPLITEFAGLPLPGAKVYHRSTAIISAIVVPTAADLGYGIEFAADRAVVGEGSRLSFMKIRSLHNLPWQQNVYRFNEAQANCFAANGTCGGLTFVELAPDREARE